MTQELIGPAQICFISDLDQRNHPRHIGKRTKPRIFLKELIQAEIDAGMFTVKFIRIFIQLFLGADLFADLRFRFGRNRACVGVKSLTEIVDDGPLAGFMAVKFQTEIFQPGFAELVIHHIQSSEFLRDEEHFLSVIETLGDDVGYGLTFPGPGRPLQNKALSRFGKFDRLHLARIRIHDGVKFHQRIGKGFRFRNRKGIRFFNRFCEKQADITVGENLLLVVDQILIHVDLEEGEDAEPAFRRDGPSEGRKKFPDGIKIRLESLIVVSRQLYAVFRVQLEREGGIHRDIPVQGADAVRCECRVSCDRNRYEKNRSEVFLIGVFVFPPVNKSEGKIGHVHAGLIEKLPGSLFYGAHCIAGIAGQAEHKKL